MYYISTTGQLRCNKFSALCIGLNANKNNLYQKYLNEICKHHHCVFSLLVV